MTAKYSECPIPRLGRTRNVDLNHTTGKCIVFIVSDDYIGCSYIEHLIDPLHQSNTDMAVCVYYLEKEIKHTRGRPR